MSLGDMIIFTVTATTLCVQLIGPAFAKLAIKKAGEIGRNVTEEDVMAELKGKQQSFAIATISRASSADMASGTAASITAMSANAPSLSPRPVFIATSGSKCTLFLEKSDLFRLSHEAS